MGTVPKKVKKITALASQAVSPPLEERYVRDARFDLWAAWALISGHATRGDTAPGQRHILISKNNKEHFYIFSQTHQEGKQQENDLFRFIIIFFFIFFLLKIST